LFLRHIGVQAVAVDDDTQEVKWCRMHYANLRNRW
jgi:hypothetical protein